MFCHTGLFRTVQAHVEVHQWAAWLLGESVAPQALLVLYENESCEVGREISPKGFLGRTPWELRWDERKFEVEFSCRLIPQKKWNFGMPSFCYPLISNRREGKWKHLKGKSSHLQLWYTRSGNFHPNPFDDPYWPQSPQSLPWPCPLRVGLVLPGGPEQRGAERGRHRGGEGLVLLNRRGCDVGGLGIQGCYGHRQNYGKKITLLRVIPTMTFQNSLLTPLLSETFVTGLLPN